MKINKKELHIRKAKLSDLDALVELENSLFDYDQLQRRNFKWMLDKGHNIFQLITYRNQLIGYGLILLNSGTSLARLYSIGILKEFRGHGLSTLLMQKIEELCHEQGYPYLRLEVKINNSPAIELYKKMGFHQFKIKHGYYEDGVDALCFEKILTSQQLKNYKAVPYYAQTTDFSCGAACLNMVLHHFNPKHIMSQANELRLWREATTIFMLAGHGGCGPRGLAIAAARRGLQCEVHLSHLSNIFIHTVKNEDKKQVIDVVHKDFQLECEELKIPIHKKALSISQLKEALSSGAIVLILISTYHFNKSKTPHWVLITAINEKFFFIHDPMIEDEQALPERANIPISLKKFSHVTKWGTKQFRAAVILRGPK